jgi:hypothetical protein
LCYPGPAASAGPVCCASRPGWNLPLPPHHGQVTSCGSPPSPETSFPVPRHGLQTLRASSGVALIGGDDSVEHRRSAGGDLQIEAAASVAYNYLMLL